MTAQIRDALRMGFLLALLSGLAPPLAAQPGTLDVGGARLHYVVAGSGPAVVLIHGWALSSREWVDQIAALSRGHRVVAYDRRGYGRSTGDADPGADPADLRALLDTLGIRVAVLVGHSAGAGVAYRFAAVMPDRVAGLVLYGGPEPREFPVPQEGPDLGPRIWAIGREHGLDSMLKFVGSLPPFQPGPHRTAAVAARLDSMVAEYSGRDVTAPTPPSDAFPRPTTAAMRRWRLPTLFISGDAERPRWHLVTDSLVRWMPHARKVVIPGGGHGVHFDEPAAFNAALLAFLHDIGWGS